LMIEPMTWTIEPWNYTRQKTARNTLPAPWWRKLATILNCCKEPQKRFCTFSFSYLLLYREKTEQVLKLNPRVVFDLSCE